MYISDEKLRTTPQPAPEDKWQKLFNQVALILKCLPSAFVDDNDHVIQAAERLMQPAPDTQAIVNAAGYFYTKLSGVKSYFFGELRESTKELVERGYITNLEPFWLQAPDTQAIVNAAVAAALEKAEEIVKTYQVSIGNSPAGEIACQMTMDNIGEILDAIAAIPRDTSSLDEYKADIKRLVDFFTELKPVMVRVEKSSLLRVAVYPADEVIPRINEIKAKYNL